jgi:hypothetical protein
MSYKFTAKIPNFASGRVLIKRLARYSYRCKLLNLINILLFIRVWSVDMLQIVVSAEEEFSAR